MLNREEFGRRLGLSQNEVLDIENSDLWIPWKIRMRIGQICSDVNTEWIVDGRGHPFRIGGRY